MESSPSVVGADAAQIGLVLATFQAASLASQFWWGRLSDRLGRRKPLLLLGTAGAGIAYLCIASVDQYGWLYPVRALEGVDFSVAEGTFHGLIGPNGSGKSTLLKALAGAHFADTGSIVFAGRDITRATPYERARAGLSLKFQITAVLRE